MGGRGSAYNDLDYLNDISQEQKEEYIKLKLGSINDFFEDEESEINDENFKKLKSLNVSMRKSTDNLNRDNLKIKQEQAIILCKEYRDYFKETPQDIQFAGENIRYNEVGGYTSSYYNQGPVIRMVLDSKRVNNPQWEKEIIERSCKEHHHASINTRDNADKYIVTHEMGHVIEHLLFERLRKNNANNRNYYDDKWLTIKVRGEVEEICKNKYTKKGEPVNMNISLYSRQNSQEWFAETFTNLHLSDEPLPVALALSEYLDNYKEN